MKKTIYTKMTKQILDGETQGSIIVELLEVETEKTAQIDIARLPKGAKGGGIFGPRFEILEHTFFIETK